jgi:hypothetical protein
VWSPQDDSWTPERFEHALAPFLERYGKVVWDHRARQAQWTILDQEQSKLYRVRQVLLDPEEDNSFFVEARVDLRDGVPEGPLLEMIALGE